MEVYNSTAHSSHNLAPNGVNDTNSLDVFNSLYHDMLAGGIKKPLFKSGMKVRLYVNKALFVKGDKPNFHDKLCTIERVISHRPEPVYEIRNSKGVLFKKRFHEQELSRVQ